MLDRGLVRLVYEKLGDKTLVTDDKRFPMPKLSDLWEALIYEGSDYEPNQVKEEDRYEHMLAYDDELVWEGFRQLSQATGLPAMFFYRLLRDGSLHAVLELSDTKFDVKDL